MQPTGRATEDGLEHDTVAGFQWVTIGGHGGVTHTADHFMSGDEGERHNVLEIARATPVERGEV